MKKTCLLVALGSLLVLASCGGNGTTSADSTIGPVGSEITQTDIANALAKAMVKADPAGLKVAAGIDGKMNIDVVMPDALSQDDPETGEKIPMGDFDIRVHAGFDGLSLKAELGGLKNGNKTSQLVGSAALQGGLSLDIGNYAVLADGSEMDLASLGMAFIPTIKEDLTLNEQIHILNDKLYIDLTSGIDGIIKTIFTFTETPLPEGVTSFTKLVTTPFGDTALEVGFPTEEEALEQVNSVLPMLAAIGDTTYSGANGAYNVHIDVNDATLKTLLASLIASNQVGPDATKEEIQAATLAAQAMLAGITMDGWTLDFNFHDDGKYFAVSAEDIKVNGNITIGEGLELRLDVLLDVTATMETGAEVTSTWTPGEGYTEIGIVA